MEAESGSVGFNAEFTALKLRYGALKEQVANQIEMCDHLVNVVAPNIKSKYMMEVGQYECRVFELETEISRWKRRFTLRQAALNLGEKPDYLAIETQIDREFAEFTEKIKKNIEEIAASSSLYYRESMGDEASTNYRVAYLAAVKLLHPDLNPGLPEAAVSLWHEIVKAYGEKDWRRMRYLAGLAKDVVVGTLAFDASADGLTALREACARLAERSRELQRDTAEMKKHLPFTYEELLDDETLLEKRREELKAQIRECEAAVRDYEKEWSNG